MARVVRKKRVTDGCCLALSLSSLYPAQHSAQEAVLPTCRVCLPISVNLSSAILPRHAEASAFTQPLTGMWRLMHLHLTGMTLHSSYRRLWIPVKWAISRGHHNVFSISGIILCLGKEDGRLFLPGPGTSRWEILLSERCNGSFTAFIKEKLIFLF